MEKTELVQHDVQFNRRSSLQNPSFKHVDRLDDKLEIMALHPKKSLLHPLKIWLLL
jgi:hypothetical protein